MYIPGRIHKSKSTVLGQTSAKEATKMPVDVLCSFHPFAPPVIPLKLHPTTGSESRTEHTLPANPFIEDCPPFLAMDIRGPSRDNREREPRQNQ